MDTGQGPIAGSGDIAEARRQLGLSALALWVGYFEVGGNGTLADIEGWLAGSSEPSDRDHDFLAQALNDQFTERGLDHPMGFRF
jgi:hypothetical protein